MNKTQLKNAVETLNDALGEYSLPEYQERIYNTVYYQLRSDIGWLKKGQYDRSNKEFSWNEYKGVFESAFGKPDSRDVPLEVLLEYAQSKLGKSLDDLIVDNKVAWSKRNQYQQSTQPQPQSPQDLDNIPY